MSFLHPEFLWLAPLLAVPILIHLLNRVRYRRMRWAAIEFLLATERRAVRRARLRQIILMILRTMVLMMALGALAQPIFSGGIGSLLGGSGQVAVALDASASMSAEDAAGAAFDRAKRAAAAEVNALPRASRVTAGTFSTRWDSPYREPVQDHGAVAAFLEAAEITGGGTDVPQAIRGAAESLARGGGGGTIWLLTDLRASGWHADQTGAWGEVRQALEKAGRPRLIVSDMGPAVTANFSISKIRLSPEILLEKDVPRLTATVRLEGSAAGARKIRLFFEGNAVDSGSVDLKESGTADVMFHLPALKSTPQTGYLELEHDAVPGDDRYYFVLRPTTSVPVLVVSGVASAMSFDGSGDFVAAALQPPAAETGARSPFAVKSIAAKDLGGAALSEYAAICLADVPRPEPEVVLALRQYVAAGGLLVVFPGAHTDIAAWNDSQLLPARFESVVQEDAEKRRKVAGVAPNNPITATLPTEGLDRLLISRYLRMVPDPAAEVLGTIEGGAPLMVRSQVGKGKVYVFAVSAQTDFSNIPFTPVLLLTVHRMLMGHLGEVRDPPSLPTLTMLEFPASEGLGRIICPDGKAASLSRRDDRPDKAFFDRTQEAGIYRLATSDGAEAVKAAVPVAAMNVPAEESSLARISPADVKSLLGGSSVYFLETDGNISQVQADTGTASAISGFPLAALAVLLLLGEVLVAWSMGRPPAPAKKEGSSASGGEGAKAAS